MGPSFGERPEDVPYRSRPPPNVSRGRGMERYGEPRGASQGMEHEPRGRKCEEYEEVEEDYEIDDGPESNTTRVWTRTSNDSEHPRWSSKVPYSRGRGRQRAH